MNLHGLRLFYMVSEHKSVTLAAQELNISQPAVTSQIKKLEQEIGFTLIAPKGRGILLTEEGKQIAKQAKRLYSLESEIETQVKQMKEGLVGKLHIAATYLPANFLLPKWIAEYKRKFPHIQIELTTTNSHHALIHLINYETEVAFIGGQEELHPLVNRTVLFEDEMWFVVHKDHKLASKSVSLGEIIHEPFVFREKGSWAREKLLSICNVYNVGQPTIGLQMNGINETIRAVLEGFGITFVSSLEVAEHIQRGDLAKVHVEGILLKNPISICTRKNDTLSVSTQKFINVTKSLLT
ncbi:LysR family transcriptional regulator [Chengkuizengella axinellae]|uniref:LysR family transcriptional regulator n=1 Tax=Chengkuizengella axinellae TaxID=3064388 RepID=A0ABT9J3R8_9BACL|nr:LysR family transcriptional regulator [Chengkuizengella sp. 2205SS18-9]MDP5276245.1 LysR family transcriptional regulator [Chengkuizengella sp. 2205SS18-9]